MDSGCAIVLVIFLAAVIGIPIAISISNSHDRERARKELEAAWVAYQASLTRLKLDPIDATLRQATLGLGRTYSNLSRDRTGVTLFDEVALMNDINAACAAASASVGQSQSPSRRERDCPFCAEPILAKAVICKHCRRDVEPLPDA
jgi:hypothetical protein